MRQLLCIASVPYVCSGLSVLNEKLLKAIGEMEGTRTMTEARTEMRSAPELVRESPSTGFRGGWLAMALLIAAVVIALSPSLWFMEFASGSENLNAGTVFEMHRDGHWLIPTLNGEPRLTKPPLTAWTSAAFIPQWAFEGISSADQTTRDIAYHRVSFFLRLPTLVLACGLILGTYWLGRAMESPRFGWAAAVVCASCVMFLRFGRAATTDVQLACWVGLANALFASLVFGSTRVWKLILLGIALGLANMAKGPVAFAQSCVPWLLFALIDGPTRGRVLSSARSSIGGVLIVAGLTLLISVPWFAYVLLRNEQAMSVWWREVTREGATSLKPDPWFSYLSIFLMMLPWTVFFLAGLGTAVVERKSSAVKLTLCLLIVPIALMSLAKDKNDRYLLPLLPAASVIVAMALRQQFRAFSEQNAGDKLLRSSLWCLLAVVMIGVPILGMTQVVKTIDATPWFSMPLAVGLLLVSLLLLGAMYFWSARRPGAIVPATLVCILALQAPLVWAYGKTFDGRSELKPIADVIRQHAPTAPVWFYEPPPNDKFVPADLSIYVNRAVKTIRDEAALAKIEPDAVMVMLQRKGGPEPSVPGWTAIDKRGYEGRNWWAFRRAEVLPQ